MRFLNELTIKNLLFNKRRTIATILGIALSTFLMIGVGVFFSSIKENYIKSTIESNGDYHVKINSITKDEIEKIKNKEFILDYKIFYSSSDVKNNWYDLYNSSSFSLNYVDSNYLSSINLVSGRLPKNDNEILINSSMNDYLREDVERFKIGDSINLNIGNSTSLSRRDYDTYSEYLQAQLDSFEIVENKMVVVVGIYNDDLYNKNGDFSKSFYTLYDDGDTLNNKMFIWYDDMYNTEKYSNSIRAEFDFCYSSMCDPISYNTEYLSLYGIDLGDDNNSYLIVMFSYFLIVLSVVSISCIFVIYNSFSISIIERKKQIGLLSSIGASRNDIKFFVFYEGIVLGIIGIVLGFLFGIFGSWLLIYILNNLVEYFSGTIYFALYKEFVIVPLLFMFLVIIVSISRPMREASKVTPIEAIRLNNDLKIERKSIKGSKLVEKLFGIEGDIAYKNMKRNKKKYNTTVISMFISIVIFLVFSSMVDYLFTGTFDYLYQFDYDYQLVISDKDMSNFDKIKANLLNTLEVDEFLLIKRNASFSSVDAIENFYSDEFKEYLAIRSDSLNYEYVNENSRFNSSIFAVMSDLDFHNYIKDNNLKDNIPVLYNRLFDTVVLNDKSTKYFTGNIFKDNSFDVSLCERENDGSISNCSLGIDSYQLSNAPFLGHLSFSPTSSLVFVISESMYEKLELSKMLYKDSNYIYMLLNGYKKIDKVVEDMMRDEIITTGSYFENIKSELDEVRNMIFAVKLVVYSFVVLVILIGMTSLFNTVNISVNLRKKEFAVLKSIGMSNRMFNKMILFESIFLGTKALLYSLPISFLLVYLLKSLNNAMFGISILLIPWQSLLVAILGVFLIVFITMKYTVSKIEKSGIIDIIREENV